MTSRQQQRLQERALAKRGEAAVAGGLPQAADVEDLAAVAFLLLRALRDTSDPRRASSAAARMHALAATSMRRHPGSARLACASGCSHCCHNWVGVTAPELFRLAAAIRRANADPSAVLTRAAPLIGQTPAQRFGAKRPCPLLGDSGTCSHYADRPTTCRQVTAFDVAGCIEEFEGRGIGGEIKVSAVAIAHARNARLPLLAALATAGLPAHTYELAEGLTRVLTVGDGVAEAEWLAGVDVFAGVQRAPADPPAVQQGVAAIRRQLAMPTRG